MQKTLNDHIFHSQSLHDQTGKVLQMQTIQTALQHGELGVNDLPNQWLAKYTRAMAAEVKELDNELLWKWWSRDTLDLQNIRVELIDILHFLVSCMIVAGITPAQVFDLYQQKHTINRERQDTGYRKKDKDETDNQTIQPVSGEKPRREPS